MEPEIEITSYGSLNIFIGEYCTACKVLHSSERGTGLSFKSRLAPLFELLLVQQVSHFSTGPTQTLYINVLLAFLGA
jgi:ribosomal protein S5